MNSITNMFPSEQTLIHLLSYLFILMFLLGLVLSFKNPNYYARNAPYGRYSTCEEGKCGVNGKVGFFLGLLPQLVVPSCLLLFTQAPRLEGVANKVLIALYLLHYSHRLFIYCPLMKAGKPMPAQQAISIFVFCSLIGYIQARTLLQYSLYTADWIRDARFISGVLLFFIGMGINIHSDHILVSLRKTGDKGYYIPRGGVFELVSGANFLGEVIEWLGYALASWSLPALMFAVLTACNLIPRAFAHHRWYLKHLQDYPRQRKVIVPYLL